MDVRRALAALSEPTRFRIVELLDAGPLTVGEVADLLGARQPATTKHLQALEAADVLTVHRLGRRRVVALRRDTVRALAEWFDTRAGQLSDESVLWQYRARIEAEEGRPADEPRRFRFQRRLPAGPQEVWSAWTQERAVREWFAPDHFGIADCTVRPVRGGEFRLVYREGDGAEHVADGEFAEVDEPTRVAFRQWPVGPDGKPMFTALHVVTLREEDGQTALDLTVTVKEIRPGAAPAIAGVEIGWNQVLDRLAAHLAGDDSAPTRG